jgi:uncharacterized protein YjbI with pentapeptide repeats
MANAEQLALLRTSIEGWNKWRDDEPDKEIDLSEADLRRATLRRANLSRADLLGADLFRADLGEAQLGAAYLGGAILSRANLSQANLGKATLSRADLSEANLNQTNLNDANLSETKLQQANLRRADLTGANLMGANLIGADLRHANLNKAILMGANFSSANLSGANLKGTNLAYSDLLGANVSNAKLSRSWVYGANVWNLKGEFKEQKDLIITDLDESPITVDNIKVAQFIYLILNNEEIRDVINTLASKTVLILGRFAIPERKAVLDTLRNKLREYDLLPIVFDFEHHTDKDFTETIKTLASLSYFVIADVTNPKSSPLELQATVPDYQIPFVPIIQEGERPFAMMVDLQKKYNWVLDTISYDSLDTLLDILKPHIIDPAIKKRDELRLIKAKEPTIISGRELRHKGTI